MNEAMRDKARNKLDMAETERKEGFKIRQQKKKRREKRGAVM